MGWKAYIWHLCTEEVGGLGMPIPWGQAFHLETPAILDPGVLGTSTLFSCGLYFPTAWPPQISGIRELLRSITWGPRPYWLDCL